MRLLKEIGGTSVFMTKEEWVGESEAEMRAWEGRARRKLLSKGVGFRPTPEEISTDEKKAGVMRAVVSMIRIVRGKLREKRSTSTRCESHSNRPKLDYFDSALLSSTCYLKTVWEHLQQNSQFWL